MNNPKQLFWLPVLALILPFAQHAIAADKPNILVVWGDDVGQSNISAYTHGLVGYLPGLDGTVRTDAYPNHRKPAS